MRNHILQTRAAALRRESTDAERHLWKFLRRRQLKGYRFRRQVPIDRYIADFACLKTKLVIELDGGQHQERKSYDLRREKYLVDKQFRVLRFWNNEVLQQTDAVLQVILDALIQCKTPPPL